MYLINPLKICIGFITDLKVSTSGNQHILTIIDHLMGWPEAFPIPDKKAYTIVQVFMNNYLPIICLRFILSDSGMEFENHFMDDVIKHLGINCIIFTPYHPQSNGKLEVFLKYLKPTLKKLCENDQDNWDPIHQPGTHQLLCNPTPHHSQNTLLPCLWKRPHFPLHQLLEPMQQFLGNPESGW